MLSPRGYDPLYALMIFSHRVLRYLSPFLHLVALGDEHRAARAGLGLRRSRSRVQLAVLLAALLAPARAGAAAADRALLRADDGVARRRAVGLAAHGTPAGWEPAEGTR